MPVTLSIQHRFLFNFFCLFGTFMPLTLAYESRKLFFSLYPDNVGRVLAVSL